MFARDKLRSKSMNKICFFYGCLKVKRNGHKNGVQIYKYWRCKRQFLGGKRVSDTELGDEYVTHQQTYSQEKSDCSAKTVQRRIVQLRIALHWYIDFQLSLVGLLSNRARFRLPELQN